ncbi:protein yellow-like [Hyposmocoma kahamanoa]|uniref:protein yellow-like n=1 Tax=Hyposmocoma kahamanoa TaxID=1477025 RepID=UPI000E6D6719|nr:protein yellow-like [Hyposmocoma kahamanoa]
MSYEFQRFFFFTFCLAYCWPGLCAESNLRVVNQWAELEFVFPNEETKQIALTKRHYVPGKSVPIDVDIQYRHGTLSPRVFITTPRIQEGRPVTLGTVDEMGKISGYPNYSWHENQGQNCEGITSVFRTMIDECNRLWMLDTGKIGSKQYCPPQLLAFNLNDDSLIYRYRLNQTDYTAQSSFYTVVTDVKPGDCGDAYVYIADVTGPALVVVDVAKNRSWRLTHRLFYPFPSRGNFTVDGESFDLMDGILGMALTPRGRNRDRLLYFHALSSTTENIVRTSVLKNDSYVGNPSVDPKLISVFPGERSSQSGPEAMDLNGIMYFGLMDPPSIWCWNSATEYNQRNFHLVAENRETLQFTTGVKVINNLQGEQELWVLTSSYQRVFTGTLSSNRTNFRIHTEKIPVILANSPCLSPPKESSSNSCAN